MNFDYHDQKCPKCGKKDVELVPSGTLYNIFNCKNCHMFFRASAPEGEVSLLIDKCTSCSKQKLRYDRTLSIGELSYEWFRCEKCGVIIQADPYGNAWTIKPP
jgi:uncharacterized Zn finger protein